MRLRILLGVTTLVALVSLQLMVAFANQSSTVHGFDPANLDRSCKPCDDFFKFATGGWNARNPIPAAYPRWGNFNKLEEQNQERLREILDDAARNSKATRGGNVQKIGDFYASGMDTEKIEAANIQPLAAELARIEKINDAAALQSAIAHLQSLGVRAPFGVGARQDFKNSTQVIAQVSEAGLGLPDRDYYIKDDAKSKQVRDAYAAHVQNMFALLGDDTDKAAAEAKAVMSIETRLAQLSMTRVQRRQPEAVYHKMDVAGLKEMMPNFSWSAYFKEIDHPEITTVNVDNPEFFKAINKDLTDVALADWKTYLRWHLIDVAAPYLSSKFEQEDFNFNKVLTGTQEMLPRWKRVVRTTDRALGEALGEIYVEKTFTPQAKARALEMVGNLIAALKSDLKTLSWMSEVTRQRATAKLEAFAKKIGYPEKWRDYSALTIDRGPYVLNVLHANQFAFNYNLSRIGQPVDRTQWGMTPPTVNAYYNPSMNEIVFPAGIMQPPFFDPQADDAVNYGGMGAVIGHEMTHGFDDQGAKFDAAGNLANWWTEEDLKNFQQRTECIVNQFSSYEVEPGLHENGKLVAGESIADLGGLTLAYAAFEKSLEGKPRPKEIDGFTPEQRFFLGWAQIWASNVRPEYARLQTQIDPHPLGRFRVNGPLSNMPAFAEAFHCKAGEAMVRPESERCQIW
ncbi:MAG: M13 family metallopeptidase [Blastocatellia bacterium]